MNNRLLKFMLEVIMIFLSFLFLSSCDNNILDEGIPDTSDDTIEDNADDENKLKISNIMNTYIDALIKDTPSYIPAWNKESFKGRWNYIDGVFLNSIVSLYYTYKDTNPTKALEYKNFFINYINYYIDENGEFVSLIENGKAYITTELDSVCASKILFDAYEMTKDNRYKVAIEYTYNNLINMDIVNGSNGNYSHKETYLDQIWLDGMYMYVPFYARYAIAHSNNDIFDIIKSQYQFIRENMFDNEKKLYYHGYSSEGAFWADENGLSENFWLRSMGWYIVSLVDSIELFPEGNNKEYLIGLLKEALDGIMQYQDYYTKMFYQIIDKPNLCILVPAQMLKKFNNTKYMENNEYCDAYVKNYVESSGSSMIAYACMKAANSGYVDESYLEKGIQIFNGIFENYFDETTNSLNNICITAGLGPNEESLRDGSCEYYLAERVGSNDAKGVGPFIMAYLQYTNGNVVVNNNIKFN